MRLFIKRNNLADDVMFTVFDEKGNDKYYAVRKKLKSTKTSMGIIISDVNKITVAKIYKLPIVTTNSYTIKANNSRINLVCVTSSKGINCHYYGNNWHINGNLTLRDFKIIDVDNTLIATQTKNKAYFELNVANCDNELFCVATSICINLINTVDNFAAQTV